MSTQLTANLQVVAGIISLLNDWLFLRGQDPLGFLKPWLYESGFIALDDLTVGSNPGCNTPGFPATVGWDPVRAMRLVTCSLSELDDPRLCRSRVSERLTSTT